MGPQLVVLTHPEKKRTYLFSDGSVSFDNVVAVGAPPGRSHRLETADGGKHIVNPNYLAITIDTPEWSF